MVCVCATLQQGTQVLCCAEGKVTHTLLRGAERTARAIDSIATQVGAAGGLNSRRPQA
jgi:hypothetical protein